MNLKRKGFIGILVLILLISFIFAYKPSANYAADDTTTTPKQNKPGQDKIEVSDKKAIVIADTGAKAVVGEPGDKVRIELPLAVNREYVPSLNYVLRNITIEPIIPTERSEIENWPFEIDNASYIKRIKDMTYNSRADVFYDFTISQRAQKGVYPVPFLINATIWRKDDINGTQIKEDVEFELFAYVNVTENGSESKVTNEMGALSVATVEKDGSLIPAPQGNAGERIKFKIPIINNGGTLTDINIHPVISTSLDEWPFIVEVVNYGRKIPRMNPRDVITLEYEFTISPEVTSGAKPINFRATYMENGKMEESLFSAYINVIKGKEEPKEPVELPDSVPKLMVVSYTTNPETIYAGKPFELTLKLQNTSKNKSIKNASIALTLAEEELMPDIGKSDSAYIDYLGPEKTATRTFYLKALPTAVNPTSIIVVNMEYETPKVTKGTYSQAIVLEIKQEVKVSLGEPAIYGAEHAKGEPIAVTIPIMNKGKGKIFNLQVDVEGEGLAMVEEYYGGDLLPAAKTDVDFQIIGTSPGEIQGSFIIKYEDIDGAEYMEELPFQLVIKEEDYLGSQIVEEQIQTKSKKNKDLIVGGTLGALALIGGAYYMIKKGRFKL